MGICPQAQRLYSIASSRVAVGDEVHLTVATIDYRFGGERLHRSGPTVEAVSDEDLTETEHAIEISYEGSYELDEATMADGSTLDDHFSAMGGWISSTLVRLGDLNFEFLPPLEKDDS